jgi:hypothetical protein
MRDWHGEMYYNRGTRDKIDRFAYKSRFTNMQQCPVIRVQNDSDIGHAIAAAIVVHVMMYS